MDIRNRNIGLRLNRQLRKIIAGRMKKSIKNDTFTIICNNCLGGFLYHDMGLRFNTPTINMFFHSLDFFDFVEHFDYYIENPLIQIPNPHYDKNDIDYPVAVLKGEDGLRDLELHFSHYKTFEEANSKWEARKKRINKDNMFVIFTFYGIRKDIDLYKRAQNLPVKNKLFFVNHPIDRVEYPSFFYIKGFENQVGVGQVGSFQNLMGKRYYDQFDFVKWFNSGGEVMERK